MVRKKTRNFSQQVFLKKNQIITLYLVHYSSPSFVPGFQNRKDTGKDQNFIF